MKVIKQYRVDENGRVFSHWLDNTTVLTGNETMVVFFILGLIAGAGITFGIMQ